MHTSYILVIFVFVSKIVHTFGTKLNTKNASLKGKLWCTVVHLCCLFTSFTCNNHYAGTRFDCYWINGVSKMWMILSWMKRLTTSKQPDLMIYQFMIRSYPIHIKRRHLPIHRMPFQRTVIITLTMAIIIPIQIKCIQLDHRCTLHHQRQQLAIYPPTMAIQWIIIQELIDTGPDFRIQLTKGEKFFWNYASKCA